MRPLAQIFLVTMEGWGKISSIVYLLRAYVALKASIGQGRS